MTYLFPMRRLDQLADVGAGNPAPQGTANFVGGTMPFFRTSDVGRLHLGDLSEAEDWVNDTGARGMRLHPAGTVLMPKSGASTFTDHRVITTRPGYVSSHLATIKSDGQNACDRYLYYALQTISARDVVGDSSYPTLSLAQVKAIEVPAPLLAEQQRIVAILDSAFKAIVSAEQSTEKALVAIVALENSILDRAVAEAAALAPSVPLEQCCTRLTVGHVGPMVDRYVEDGVPFLRSQNVRPFELDLNEVKFIDQEFDVELRKSRLRPGDVAIVRTGYPGTASVIPDDLPVSNCADMVIATPSEGLDSHFLALFLNSPSGKALVGDNLTGAAQKHFNVGAAKRAPMPLPSWKEQRSIVARVALAREQCKALRHAHQRKLSALAELKQSLLASAFSGKLTARRDAASNHVFATPEQSANVIAYIYWRHERAQRNLSYRRVKAQKALDLVERVGGVELGRAPYKDAAGPNDFAHMNEAQAWAKKNQFFEFVRRDDGYEFKKLARYGDRIAAAQGALKPIASQLDRVAEILLPKDKEESEVFATVLAAWNNLVADGQDANDAAIIAEARDNWHEEKLKIAVSKFTDAIREIRRLNLVPDGTAKVVRHRQASLL